MCFKVRSNFSGIKLHEGKPKYYYANFLRFLKKCYISFEVLDTYYTFICFWGKLPPKYTVFLCNTYKNIKKIPPTCPIKSYTVHVY